MAHVQNVCIPIYTGKLLYQAVGAAGLGFRYDWLLSATVFAFVARRRHKAAYAKELALAGYR